MKIFYIITGMMFAYESIVFSFWFFIGVLLSAYMYWFNKDIDNDEILSKAEPKNKLTEYKITPCGAASIDNTNSNNSKGGVNNGIQNNR